MTINLARHLLKGLSFSDPTIVSILSNSVIHIVPVIDKAFEQVIVIVFFVELLFLISIRILSDLGRFQ